MAAHVSTVIAAMCLSIALNIALPQISILRRCGAFAFAWTGLYLAFVGWSA